jgi:CubicO group peptidase (beta-lactamase class C family)
MDELAAVLREPIASESSFRLQKFEQTVGLKPVERMPGETRHGTRKGSRGSLAQVDPCRLNDVVRRWFIQLLRLLLVAPVLILGFSRPAHAQSPETRRPSESVPSELVQSLRQHLNQLTAAKKFSGAVLLAKGEEILLKEGYGSHASHGSDRHAEQRPINPETKFHLASVTKVFTAVAILQLAQRKFTLDDTLITVLPDYPNKDAAAKITIQQLLVHRSGLCNGFEKFAQLDFARYSTPASFLSAFANEPLEFAPGTRSSYSNAGYLLLGVIVQKVSGESYETYVENNIFKPSRMKDSEWITSETRGLNAIGGGRSTVEDLFRFSRALQGGKLLNNDLTALALSGGAGMTAEKINGADVVGHIGGAPGMSTSFDIYPALGFTVVVLSAQDGAALPVRDEFRKELTRR